MKSDTEYILNPFIDLLIQLSVPRYSAIRVLLKSNYRICPYQIPEFGGSSFFKDFEANSVILTLFKPFT